MKQIKTKHGFITTEERSNLMRKIMHKDTKPELDLRRGLWKNGYRYRLNVVNLPGKPDIVFKRYKLAIFIDGEFWHGYKWENKKGKIKSNRDYWIAKIEKNIARDKMINEQLLMMGWSIIRFWANDVRKDLSNCIDKVISEINKMESIMDAGRHQKIVE